MKNPFRHYNTSPEIIRMAAMMYVHFPLSGGLGICLRMNTQELENQNAIGVITLIICLVIASEITSHFLHRRFYKD